MKWQAIITSVNNGYQVEFKDGDKPQTTVYQQKDNENQEHIVEMLWDILGHFGVSYSKHKEKNIHMEWK